ncbi:MAG TPA: histidine phosphatase family protein [Segetibacter sp.]|jgi:2,3-bisphosphoglycerate-dependent phosphoglycerate mutase
MKLNSFKSIYLIRHCKADGQEPDAKLTNEGREQAYKLGDFLYSKQIDYIISSSYERAIATIEPLAQKINLKVNTDARLCERILSSEVLNNWEERLYDTFKDSEMRLPGGETSSEAMERGISVINDLFERSEKSIAVVTHGNIMCLMLRYYNTKYGFDEWKNLTNPDVFELLIPDKKELVRIKRIWE